MNILSLFDGMSGGQIAFDKLGIKFDGNKDKYFASEIKKNGIKVTKHNYPNTIHIGDVTKVSYKDGVLYTENGEFKEKIDMIIGGSPCFAAGTLILTNKGYKKIEDIVEGDMVLTHTNTYKKVVVPMRKISNNIYRLKTICSEDLLVTEEHPFYVINKSMRNDEVIKPYWVKTKDLTTNHMVGIAINNNSIIPNYSKIEKIFLDNDFWYLVGLFFYTGYTRDNEVSFIIDNKEYQNLKLFFDKHNLIYSSNLIKNDKYNINILDEDVNNFLLQFIKPNIQYVSGLYGKRITNNILDLPICMLKKFILGLTSNHNKQINKIQSLYMHNNRELAYALGECIAKAFKVPYFIKELDKNYILQFNLYSNTHKNSFYKDGYIWFDINNIVLEKYNNTVYNMEVEEDHSYTVNNIIVHNCQDFSLMKMAKANKYGLQGDKSKLFYEYLRLLHEVNPKYFLLENVKMKKDSEEQLNKYLGVTGLHINSRLVSYQNRPRIYWTNIPNVTIPEDKHINFQDFKETNPDICKKYKLNPTPSRIKMWNNGNGNTKLGTCANVTNAEKVYCLTRKQDRSPNAGLIECEDFARFLTRKELEMAQTIPIGYTDILSYNAMQDVCGDGWTIDVIAHILSFIDFNEFN